ncbi:MAG: acetate--CoA ligase family protein [Thermodesulfobacteriota bacterium]|nr:acetate--CoA ligase family protein [Thermodesulfobacteriota bacterium]
MNSNLHPLLNPESIAIIGVSKDPSRIGGRILKYLKNHGYNGVILPVNPKYQEIEGIKCYSNISSIPFEIDVALIAVPEDFAISVLEEGGKAKVKSAIIYSAGFSELGEKGKVRQEKIKQVAEENGMLVCGPNCVGIIGFHNRTAMSFSQFLDIPKLIPGNIAFISQSGALGGAILNRIQDRSIGISYFISTGNEAVLESSDFIEYLLNELNTTVIMALIEGIRDAEKFLRVADLAAEKGKPIVVLKIGKTESGGKAASSHTGSMTGSDMVYDAVFRQKGIIRVEEVEDLYLTASTLARCQPPKGNRVGIITTTGGGGVILTDKLVEMGMDIPGLSTNTVAKLTETKASFGIIKNPLDLTAQVVNDPSLFPKSIETFIQDENLDNIIVALAMVAGDRSKERASHIIQAAHSTDKPILTWWASGSLSNPGMKMIEESRVPLFTSPHRGVKALNALVRYSRFLETYDDGKVLVISTSTDNRQKIDKFLTNPSQILTEDEGKEILSYYGIPIPLEGLGRNLDEIKVIVSRIGYPVALKIISPQIQHKTELGGVRLNIKNEKELGRAYEEIMENLNHYKPDADIRGMLVQEMVPPGKEVIIGAIQDPQFGPMVMFGLGGIFVEVLKDFSLRHAPLKERDAWEMVREIKGNKILEGVRGEKKSDQEAIVRALMAVSQMAVDLKGVFSEIDINPLVVYPEGGGLKAVDCLFLKKGGVKKEVFR